MGQSYIRQGNKVDENYSYFHFSIWGKVSIEEYESISTNHLKMKLLEYGGGLKEVEENDGSIEYALDVYRIFHERNSKGLAATLHI